MEPRDLTVEEFLRTHASVGGSPQTNVHRSDSYWYYTCHWNVLFADAHLQSLSVPFPEDVLAAFVTVDGGEPVDWESGNVAPRKHWQWGRVVATAVFLVLCVLPLARLFQRGSREPNLQSGDIDPSDEAAPPRS
jgi:hypothetical protein